MENVRRHTKVFIVMDVEVMATSRYFIMKLHISDCRQELEIPGKNCQRKWQLMAASGVLKLNNTLQIVDGRDKTHSTVYTASCNPVWWVLGECYNVEFYRIIVGTLNFVNGDVMFALPAFTLPCGGENCSFQ